MSDQQRATSAVVDFVGRARWQDFPKEAVRIAKRCVIDGLGVMLAGSTQDAGRILRGYVRTRRRESPTRSGRRSGSLCRQPRVGCAGAALLKVLGRGASRRSGSRTGRGRSRRRPRVARAGPRLCRKPSFATLADRGRVQRAGSPASSPASRSVRGPRCRCRRAWVSRGRTLAAARRRDHRGRCCRFPRGARRSATRARASGRWSSPAWYSDAGTAAAGPAERAGSCRTPANSRLPRAGCSARLLQPKRRASTRPRPWRQPQAWCRRARRRSRCRG